MAQSKPSLLELSAIPKFDLVPGRHQVHDTTRSASRDLIETKSKVTLQRTFVRSHGRSGAVDRPFATARPQLGSTAIKKFINCVFLRVDTPIPMYSIDSAAVARIDRPHDGVGSDRSQ